MKLAPLIDPSAWDAFLAEYFAAAARLIAPYDQVRLTATFRIETETKDGRDDQDDHRQRLTLLRSGRFARYGWRVRYRLDGFERATLAHPDHSLHAFRDLGSRPGPWTIGEDARSDPLQAYRQALDRVESVSGSWFFVATHGGATLLELPQTLKATDYEVVKFHTTSVDGHRLVTLRLRTGPEVKGRDRNDLTFVFDADDLFVVRSVHSRDPLKGPVMNRCFAYDHPDGRPVLRSSVTTIPARHRTMRLDVEECKFGPIPEAEFALETFLASLGPHRPKWPRAIESSTAALLDGCWLAFVGGGISLACGSGLALRSRYRDRKAVRAD